MASEMVMAIGDSGRMEPTPINEVVEIPVLRFATHPKTGGDVGIPETVRALTHVFGLPVRLTGISAKGQPWPYVRWIDDRGKRAGCYVRSRREAEDTLFDSLSQRSRERIVRAVETVENAA